MGYDIYGVNAKTSKGEYFRNNIWWWSNLWEYVCDIGLKEGILTQEDCGKGGHNGGEKIGARKAAKLAKALQESIDNGTAALFQKKIDASKLAAVFNNKDKKFGDPGYSYDDSYPFSITNLKEFTDFVKDSGGFEIC